MSKVHFQTCTINFEQRSTVHNYNIKTNKEVLKSFAFCDIKSCKNRHYGGIYRINLQGRIINQTKNQHEAGSKKSRYDMFMLIYFLVYSSTLKMEAPVHSWRLSFFSNKKWEKIFAICVKIKRSTLVRIPSLISAVFCCGYTRIIY
jgi:hypothetical protein